MGKKPLAIDLYCGLGGWTAGLLAEEYDVVGFDIEQHVYGDERYPAQLVVQDVLTLHGSQFRDATLIVASPPCQEYSYMAMPWTRAKDKARAIRADDTGAALERLNMLFNACFRLQREACEAAGRHIPMVVENVRGAQPWVGRAAWNFGSYYLWGDVPALMPPITSRKNTGGSWFNIGSPGQTVTGQNPVHSIAKIALQDDGVKRPSMNWNGSDKPGHKAVAFNDSRHDMVHKVPGFRFNGSGKSFQTASVESGRKAPSGTKWFNDGPRTPESLASSGSKSSARKMASATIAKIPFSLSRHIAATFRREPINQLARA